MGMHDWQCMIGRLTLFVLLLPYLALGVRVVCRYCTNTQVACPVMADDYYSV